MSQRDRLTKLTGNVSDEELERVRTEYDVAVANRRQAIVEAEATVAAARQRLAMLETALQRLDDTTVVVPFPERRVADHAGRNRRREARTPRQPRQSRRRAIPCEDSRRKSLNRPLRPPKPADAQPDEYVVAKKLVVVGTMVRSFPSVPVFELVRDYELKLMGSLPERYVGAVEQPVAGKPPQEVEIVTEAYPEQVFKGRVQVVSPVVETTSRTFPVEVRVPNAARKLKAGSFAKARILAREEAVVPTVPEEAIVPFAGVIKVFVVQDGKAHAVEVKQGTRMEIKTGGRTVNWVEVTGDSSPDARVVTSGHSQLAEGTPVRLRGGEQREIGRRRTRSAIGDGRWMMADKSIRLTGLRGGKQEAGRDREKRGLGQVPYSSACLLLPAYGTSEVKWKASSCRASGTSASAGRSSR